MAKCKICGATEETAEFYPKKNSYCKKHWKQYVKEGRSKNIEYYREYDRSRANMPHRVEAIEIYQKTIAFAESHQKACKKYKELNPQRRSAQLELGNAVRSGKINPLPCFSCGCEKTEAHHPDYSRPLDVVWLCPVHHKQAHAMAKKAA